jgi:hypothetical protein
MGRLQTRDCTEDYRRLDVRQLKRHGCLHSGWSGIWQWSRGGERVAWICVEASDGQITLRYRNRWRGEESGIVVSLYSFSLDQFGVQRRFPPCLLSHGKPFSDAFISSPKVSSCGGQIGYA